MSLFKALMCRLAHKKGISSESFAKTMNVTMNDVLAKKCWKFQADYEDQNSDKNMVTNERQSDDEKWQANCEGHKR